MKCVPPKSTPVPLLPGLSPAHFSRTCPLLPGFRPQCHPGLPASLASPGPTEQTPGHFPDAVTPREASVTASGHPPYLVYKVSFTLHLNASLQPSRTRSCHRLCTCLVSSPVSPPRGLSLLPGAAGTPAGPSPATTLSLRSCHLGTFVAPGSPGPAASPPHALGAPGSPPLPGRLPLLLPPPRFLCHRGASLGPRPAGAPRSSLRLRARRTFPSGTARDPLFSCATIRRVAVPTFGTDTPRGPPPSLPAVCPRAPRRQVHARGEARE